MLPLSPGGQDQEPKGRPGHLAAASGLGQKEGMSALNSAATGSGVRVPESGSRGVSVPQVGQPRLPHGDGSPWRAWLSPSQVPGNTASPPQGPLFQEAKRVEQTLSARGARTAAPEGSRAFGWRSTLQSTGITDT